MDIANNVKGKFLSGSCTGMGGTGIPLLVENIQSKKHTNHIQGQWHSTVKASPLFTVCSSSVSH